MTHTNKRRLGFAFLSLPFVALFIATLFIGPVWVALSFWGSLIAAVGAIIIGIELVES